MQRMWTTVAFLAALVGAASSGFAQGVDEPLLSRTIPLIAQQLFTAPDLSDVGAAARAAEMQQWVKDFTEWKEWSEQWGNRRQRGLLTGYRERREVPVPPGWLADSCATVVDDSEPVARACTLLAEWTEDVATILTRQASNTTTTDAEQPEKTVWWEHLHMDVLWPAMQWQASVYGVIGMHTATTVRGRFQVFITPGAMLLNLPTRNGGRAWKVATNYGIGYRLFDFTFFGGRPATLHVNLAKAWLLADIADVATGRSMDFVGFSIAFKQVR
jgi:hypothetical protein